MAVKINKIIPLQASELIQVHILKILTEELANQFFLSPLESIFNCGVVAGRCTTFDSSELPHVNILVDKINYIRDSSIEETGENVFTIDVWTKSNFLDGVRGDTLSDLFNQRLVGAIKYILMSGVYAILDFPPGIIERVYIKEIRFGRPEKEKESDNIVCSQIDLRVIACEDLFTVTAHDLLEIFTNVKLNKSNNGYIYKSDAEDDR